MHCEETGWREDGRGDTLGCRTMPLPRNRLDREHTMRLAIAALALMTAAPGAVAQTAAPLFAATKVEGTENV